MFEKIVADLIGNTTNLAISGCHFEAICNSISRPGAFCLASCFCKAMGRVHYWSDVGLSWGTLSSAVLDLLAELWNMFAPNVKRFKRFKVKLYIL